jgi:dipeptidyl aminopeptidase/acylaminoacyl peptidase
LKKSFQYSPQLREHQGQERMSQGILNVLIGCLGFCAVAQGQVQAANLGKDHTTKRSVTVADAIGMTQIGDRSYLDAFTKGGNVAQFSPDGSRFAFVVQKGNLDNDTVEFRLLVFKTANAFTSPQPEVVATLASSSNREAISHVKWLQDNETLVFLGEQPGETPQLYRLSCATRRLEKLTSSPTPVIAYSVSDRGGSFVYVAETSSQSQITSEMREQGFVVTSERWSDLYVAPKPDFDFHKEIFVKTASMESPASLGVFDIYSDPAAIQLKISPDGRYALINAFITNPSAVWKEYRPGFETFGMATACAAGEIVLCPQQYLLINLGKKTIEPLIDAPIMQSIESGIEVFSWTHDNSVLLVNAFLPLRSIRGEEYNRRLHNVYAAEVLLTGREIKKIVERQTPFQATYIHGKSAQNRFVTQSYVASNAPIEFRKEADGWTWAKLDPSALNSEDPLSVTLDQGSDSPPKLVANDPKTKRKAVLLDLNPQFAQLAFGPVKPFHWTTKDGFHQEGLLYYPVNYVVGKRYPLILQTHGSVRDRFWIDGPFTTAFAAQPLAGHGFFVLQMPLGDNYNKESLDEVTKTLGTAKEGPYFLALFESAIDELDREGLIDRNCVGLTGFSRTVYHVLYTLTHSRYHFAAAVIADGVDFGYSNCIYSPTLTSTCEKVNGGLPFGVTLANWARESPTFRLDKIEAPLLLQAISAPIGEWEILEGLRWLKKPAEMLNFYPEGAHVLVRPRQRMLSQQTTVDWYCFWLRGEEDPDPAKAEQYRRWRKLVGKGREAQK